MVWFVTVTLPRVVCSYIDYFSNFDTDDLDPTDTILRKFHHQNFHAFAFVKIVRKYTIKINKILFMQTIGCSFREEREAKSDTSYIHFAKMD